MFGCTFETVAPWWLDTAGTGELLELRIAADGFLPKMVRNIAGDLMEIGLGRRPIDWIDELIAGCDRGVAGMTAPADGLILWRVGYEGEAAFETRDRTERE